MRFYLFNRRWDLWFAYKPDFTCSRDARVRKAWWWLYQNQFGVWTARLFGVTISYRAKPNDAPKRHIP